VSRRGLGWRQWWSGPWLPSRLVTAEKPVTRNGSEAQRPVA
jgi:hypothetical protein